MPVSGQVPLTVLPAPQQVGVQVLGPLLSALTSAEELKIRREENRNRLLINLRQLSLQEQQLRQQREAAEAKQAEATAARKEKTAATQRQLDLLQENILQETREKDRASQRKTFETIVSTLAQLPGAGADIDMDQVNDLGKRLGFPEGFAPGIMETAGKGAAQKQAAERAKFQFQINKEAHDQMMEEARLSLDRAEYEADTAYRSADLAVRQRGNQMKSIASLLRVSSDLAESAAERLNTLGLSKEEKKAAKEQYDRAMGDLQNHMDLLRQMSLGAVPQVGAEAAGEVGAPGQVDATRSPVVEAQRRLLEAGASGAEILTSTSRRPTRIRALVGDIRETTRFPGDPIQGIPYEKRVETMEGAILTNVPSYEGAPLVSTGHGFLREPPPAEQPAPSEKAEREGRPDLRARVEEAARRPEAAETARRSEELRKGIADIRAAETQTTDEHLYALRDMKTGLASKDMDTVLGAAPMVKQLINNWRARGLNPAQTVELKRLFKMLVDAGAAYGPDLFDAATWDFLAGL